MTEFSAVPAYYPILENRSHFKRPRLPSFENS